MPFSSWVENDPAGSDAASTIDDASARNMVRIRERLATVFPDWTTATDRIHLEKIFLNTLGLTGRDNNDTATLFSVNQNGVFTFDKQPACHATDSGQSISVGVYTALDFTSEVLDIGTIHDNVTNPSRFTVPVTGIYAVSFRTRGAVSQTIGPTQYTWKFRKNGTTDLGTTFNFVPILAAGESGTITLESSFVLFQLTAADYIEVLVNPTGGGATLSEMSFNIFKIA